MTTSTPASAPYASSAIMRGGYSPATESGATTSRPAYVRQFGQTRCGMRGAPQFGHALCVGYEILCVERRLFVRLCDCFCLGTAIRVGECSRGHEHVLAAVMADRVEEPLRVQPHAQVTVGADPGKDPLVLSGHELAVLRDEPLRPNREHRVVEGPRAFALALVDTDDAPDVALAADSRDPVDKRPGHVDRTLPHPLPELVEA